MIASLETLMPKSTSALLQKKTVDNLFSFALMLERQLRLE